MEKYGHYIQSQRMGLFYFPVVTIPSLASAAFTSDLSGGMKHSQRWFEVDASYLGAKYFDKKYGRGKEGYTPNSPDYFDIESFRQGSPSSYYNMRLSIKNGKETANSRRYPTSGANVLVWDFFLL